MKIYVTIKQNNIIDSEVLYMNLLHMKYAVEVARTGSINKAAEKLLIGQPNLSRAVKELESSLGVTIFKRSAKGMRLTPDGEVFISYAQNILKQIDALEDMFNQSVPKKKRFSICVPGASYISDAFANFSLAYKDEKYIEMFYDESNAMKAIDKVLQEDYNLGIIRYAENYDKYYKAMMDEKELDYEMITEFRYQLVMSKNSRLAKKSVIRYDDLKNYIEIAHADPYVPSVPQNTVKKEELPDYVTRRIFVFERASQFELLCRNPDTFMWVSKIPEDTLSRFDLVQKQCDENGRIYKDVLIHRKNYVLSELDNRFISELCRSKREIFK